MFSSHLHCVGSPLHHRTTIEAKIAEQRSSSCAEAKYCIFHDGLPRANCRKESFEVIIAVAVALRSHIFVVFRRWRSGWVRQRILLPVAFQRAFLHGFREGINRVSWFLSKRRTAYADRVPGNFHGAFRAGKDQPLALLASIHEIDAQAKVEAFAIVKEAEHDVGSVSPVFPETQPSRCHCSRGTVCPRNEVGAAEQVHEKVSSHAASVGFPLAPLEKVFGVKGNAGSSSQEARPIAGFRRSIWRNGIVPRAH